jgi:hypothetical protein
MLEGRLDFPIAAKPRVPFHALGFGMPPRRLTIR